MKNKNGLLVMFGNPYALKYFCNSKGVLVAYDEKPETQTVAADIVTGYLRPKGKLPVTVCPSFKEGNGKSQLVHSLNGSSLALPRIVACLLENNQSPGGIKLPAVLHKYFGAEGIQ